MSYEIRDKTVALVRDREYVPIFVERYSSGTIRLSQRNDTGRDEILISAEGWEDLLDALTELGG